MTVATCLVHPFYELIDGDWCALCDGSSAAPGISDEGLGGLLDELRDWFTGHVAYASPHHPVAVTLWAAHTHALDRAASTPRLAFLSPEPESGKTRNLELLEPVARHGRLVLQMSPASMFRWVQALRPTILLDELDSVFGSKASNDHEDLRALINSGHRARGDRAPSRSAVDESRRVLHLLSRRPRRDRQPARHDPIAGDRHPDAAPRPR
ncbi:MAG: hypothetical protein ACRD0U_15535 [Acidimicrobiales bacterium]